MLIFGYRTSERPVSSGQFFCPACESQQSYRRSTTHNRFTFFFIPLFPLPGSSDHTECQKCFRKFNSFDVSFADQGIGATTSDEPMVAELVVGSSDSRSPFSAAAGSEYKTLEKPPDTSAMAIASFVLGLLSPLLLIACGLSIFTSILAVILGHVSLSRIKRSTGALEGRWMAITGLTIGYPVLLLSIVVFTTFFGGVVHGIREGADLATSNSAVVADDPSYRLRNVETAILTPAPEGAGYGNTETAKRLASDFAKKIGIAREALIEGKSGGPFSLSRGKFVVHCELHPGSCVFVVHVPAYRKFAPDAKKVIAQAAWIVAHETLSGTAKSGDDLAVALRGTLLYGTVMTGKTSDSEELADFVTTNRDGLLAFFPAPAVEEPSKSEFEPSFAPDAIAEIDAKSDLDVVDNTASQIELRPTENLEPRPSLAIVPKDDGKVVLSRDNRPALDLDTEQRQEPKHPQSYRDGKSKRREFQLGPNVDQLFQSPMLGWGVACLAFSPDSQTIVCGEPDSKLWWFDIESGQQIGESKKFRQINTLTGLTVSRDGKFLLASDYSGQVFRLSLDESGISDDPLKLIGLESNATVLKASRSADFVLSGSQDGQLMWQPYHGKPSKLRTFQAHSRKVMGVYLPRKGVIGLSTNGREIVRFNLKSATQLEKLKMARPGLQAVCFSSDGSRLAMATGSDIRVFDTENGQLESHLKPSKRGVVWNIVFHPSKPWLVAGGRGTVTLFDVELKQELETYLVDEAYIKNLEVSPDGNMLALSQSRARSTLRVIRLPTE